MTIETVNPATGELIKKFDEFSDAEIENKLRSADDTFRDWRRKSFDDRALLMKKAAEYLRDNNRRLAEIITLEMGKAIKESIAEIEKCAVVCDYYAEHAESILKPRPIETDAHQSYARYDPIGAVLAVMPWNFPFWQVFRFAAPSLMAGNVGLLKHASNVPMSALEIEKVFVESGFPEGAFGTLMIGSAKVEGVIRDRRVVATTLTGSDGAGRKVAATSGSVLKKSVLELGGSDPFIVLADADLDRAATTAAKARNLNAGQSCIAAKRFIAVREIADAFSEKFRAALSALKVGDPMDESTDVGPMARADMRSDIDAQVKKSLGEGARLDMGGEVPDGPGYFYPVTLMSEVTPEMTVAVEETFGPLAALLVTENEAEAIALANQSDFGLSSSLWTADLEKGKALAAEIEAGCVFINGMSKSDPRLPFGGIKISGFGRELSDEGIREFTNVKTVWVGK